MQLAMKIVLTKIAKNTLPLTNFTSESYRQYIESVLSIKCTESPVEPSGYI